MGPALLAWLLWRCDWTMVLRVLRQLDFRYLALYFLANAVCFLLKVARFRSFVIATRATITRRDAFAVAARASFWGAVTPGRLGEVLKIDALGARGVPMATGATILVMERAIDLGALLVVSAAFAATTSWQRSFQIAIASSGAIGLLVLGLLCAPVALSRSTRFFATLFPPSLHHQLAKMQAASELLSGRSATRGTLVGLIATFGAGAQVFILARALHVAISVGDTMSTYGAATLAGLIPISVAGLGTREAVYAASFETAGFATGLAVTLSLLDGFVFAVSIAAIYWAIAAGFARAPKPADRDAAPPT